MVKINIGICKGYNNSFSNIDGEFNYYLFNKLEEISKEQGIYIPFIVYETKTIYKKEWGCINGGEITFNLEAIRNPKFEKDDKKWRDNILTIIEILKEDLEQSTVTIQFITVNDLVYLTSEGE